MYVIGEQFEEYISAVGEEVLDIHYDILSVTMLSCTCQFTKENVHLCSQDWYVIKYTK